MKFLRNLLATLVGLFLFTVFCFFVLMAIAMGLESEDQLVLKENSVLHITLEKPIAERTFEDPFDGYGFAGGSAQGILNLLDAIDYAKTDERIKGIYIQPRYFIGGFSQAQELRNALLDFKSSGKFILGYSDRMSEGSYYIASAADSIFLHPEGDLEFNGIAYQGTFFKGTLDKLGIEAQVFKVGDYKSAIEPFVRKNMSDENREQVDSFIQDIYNRLLDEIGASRGVDVPKLQEISSEMLVQNTQDAVKYHLADDLMYEDKMEDVLSAATGENYDLVSISSYQKSYSRSSSSSNRIAVIVASGEILNGDAPDSYIGADRFVDEIRQARESSRVKAVVLRVNSPGGDFLASDRLWNEVALTREVKPVIASMSTYAASGGYYMSMSADTIVASPNTITGSIGIFSILFNLSSFMEDKLGITSDVVKTGKYSDIITTDRPLTDFEKGLLQKGAEEGYESFVTKAAAGRGMTIEEIDAIASGRVWTGMQAKENGLVDVLGGYNDAVAIAAEKAGITGDYKVVLYPAQKTFFEQLMSDLGMSAQTKISKVKSGELYPYLQMMEKLKHYSGVQARMPFEGAYSF